ncbi:9573_t:CDS:2, partial [Cetraspora pellucida]
MLSFSKRKQEHLLRKNVLIQLENLDGDYTVGDDSDSWTYTISITNFTIILPIKPHLILKSRTI